MIYHSNLKSLATLQSLGEAGCLESLREGSCLVSMAKARKATTLRKIDKGAGKALGEKRMREHNNAAGEWWHRVYG